MVWLLVIACESTSLFSGGNTMVWTRRLLALFSDHVTWTQVYYFNHALRKTGHFVGYATLSWFAFRGWMETLEYQRERFLVKAGRPVARQRRWHLRAAVLAVLVTAAVAGLDEFHQSFIRGRTGVFRDVVLDTMGGIFAQTLLLLYWTRRKKMETKAEFRSAVKVIVAD
jgi:VanZ family protein